MTTHLSHGASGAIRRFAGWALKRRPEHMPLQQILTPLLAVRGHEKSPLVAWWRSPVLAR